MNRIKQLRNEEGLTQKELAEAFNKYIYENNLTIKPINFSVISKWETGKSSPTKATYEALANYFDVSVPYLQGKILFVDLSEDEQRIFNDVLDVLITTTDNKAIHVLEALLNSFKECCFEENIRIAPEKK